MRTILTLAADCIDLSSEVVAAVGIALRGMRRRATDTELARRGAR